MSELITVTIGMQEAIALCGKALRDYVISQGVDGDKDIVNEKWYLNCKRKGIVFKGYPHDNNQLNETGKEGRKGSGTGKHVPKDSK